MPPKSPRRASLAWRPRSGVLQSGSDSSPVSERPSSTVPVPLLCRGRRCLHSATAAFQQPSTFCSSTLPAQYLWSPGLFSCQPHGLELSPGFYPGPDHQCRLFQTPAPHRSITSDPLPWSSDNTARLPLLVHFSYLL